MSKSTIDSTKPEKTCPDILRWQPSRWGQFLGNKRIIKNFKRMVKQIRSIINDGAKEDFNRLCFLLYGPSRSGKTALVKFLVRCITCQNLDLNTLNPCDGTCSTCCQKPEICGLEGLHSWLATEYGNMPINFIIVDCTMIQTPEQLRNKLLGMTNFDGLRIFYFDEVHRLVQRGMDEMLLKAVEEKNYLWLFSTAKPEGLEDMFQNRLLKLKTECPTAAELESWLADRCEEWGINWEAEAIVRAAEKSNLIVGTALHALALAAIDPKEGLTLDLVENEWIVRLGM